MFKRVYSFEGRIRRREYGISLLIFYFAEIVLSAIAFILCELRGISLESAEATLIQYAFIIPILPFLLTQSAKRCHDIGRSGWYQIVPFYVLLLLFKDGEPGENEFGPDPKGRSYESAETV